MAGQSSYSSSLPSLPSQALVTAREVAFLAAGRRLAGQPKPSSKIAGKPRRKSSIAKPLTIREGLSTESASATRPEVAFPVPSSESELKSRDNKEVFGSILSNMKREGWLPEAGIVNQPLPSEEEMAKASRRMALATTDPKETVPIDSNEGPIKIVLEVIGAKKQSESAEGKKKRKSKEKCLEGDEASRLKKEKKEKKESEKKQRRREEKRLKKEKKRKRVESPNFDGESTTTRVEEGVSTQAKASAQPQVSSPHIRMVATEDREDPDITPLMQRRKENAPQGSTSDPLFFQRIVEEAERRKREAEEKKEKLSHAHQIIASGDLARKLHDEDVCCDNAKAAEE
ncbi:SMY2 homolog 2-like [Benincasa hispida]|uniref:SMY2 homolog 2-like n=1 Tax=Benincasa hispida TaxID=102211 RepID=UPI001902B482|nr:SMY2 homolog 2-like [Benincasa hispida]